MINIEVVEDVANLFAPSCSTVCLLIRKENNKKKKYPGPIRGTWFADEYEDISHIHDSLRRRAIEALSLLVCSPIFFRLPVSTISSLSISMYVCSPCHLNLARKDFPC